MNPSVSVVMPNYNGAEWISQAIGSVVNQTYKNWHLIVVDDGSTDDSREILSEWGKKFKFRRINIEENTGSPVAPRNTGIDLSKGDYIAFLDSDDSWLPDKLEKQVRYVEASKGVFCYHDFYLNGRRWSQLSKPHSGYCFKELLFKNFIPSSSVMVRRDVLMKEPVLQKSTFFVSHDWELWLRIAYKYKIDYIPMALGFLRMGHGGVTSQTRLRRKESRKVVRLWKGSVPWAYYTKCLGYYYLVEMWDLLPKIIKQLIRKRG